VGVGDTCTANAGHKWLYDFCTIRAKIVELACFQKVGMVELVGIELCRSVEDM
jgi:hypothetical protein